MLLRAFAVLLLSSAGGQAYSVLSHEAIVDSAWQGYLAPAIEKRFGKQTPEALTEARAYAYGGCVIQDMGYYPLSSKFFSDLLHYVRSGDFVVEQLQGAKDVKEYAFALGSLAHYVADNTGHYATNRAVPMMYPKKRRQFGDVMTYADYPAGHIQTEFSFDVLQVARGRYKSDDYHQYVGFEVAEDLLKRSFANVYGFELKDIFAAFDLALGTYRWSVSELLPKMTRVALADKEHSFEHTRTAYEKRYGRKYRRPGFGARLMAWILRVVPKVGPFKALAFRPPTQEVEKLFLATFDSTVKNYEELLTAEQGGGLQLKNTNLDDGKPSARGEYQYADRAFSKLREKLDKLPQDQIPPALRAELSRWAEQSTSGSSKKRSSPIRQ